MVATIWKGCVLAEIGVLPRAEGMTAECVVATMQTEGCCTCGECDSAWFWETFSEVLEKKGRRWSSPLEEVMGAVWIWVVEHPEDVAHRWQYVHRSSDGSQAERASTAMSWIVNVALDRGFRDNEYQSHEVSFSSLVGDDNFAEFADSALRDAIYVQ